MDTLALSRTFMQLRMETEGAPHTAKGFGSGQYDSNSHLLLAKAAMDYLLKSDVVETLMAMTAATVLAKLIEDEGGGRSNVSFSPLDMDAMSRNYEMTHTKDGLITTVKLTPTDPKGQYRITASVMTQDEDTTNAKPQAEPAPERPYWFYHDSKGRSGPFARSLAERFVAESPNEPTTRVENRACRWIDCPNSDIQSACERCRNR